MITPLSDRKGRKLTSGMAFYATNPADPGDFREYQYLNDSLLSPFFHSETTDFHRVLRPCGIYTQLAH